MRYISYFILNTEGVMNIIKLIHIINNNMTNLFCSHAALLI